MIDVVPMERNEESFEFALAVKKEAFGPHIMERWGWDQVRGHLTPKGVRAGEIACNWLCLTSTAL